MLSTLLKILCGCLVAITLPATSGGQQDTVPQYTRKQIREMKRSAKTVEDHERLAAYFHAQERLCREKEAEQRKALDEYSKAPQSYPTKYPTRADSARHVASQYAFQAQKASDLALEQEQLAARKRAEKKQ